MNNFLTRTLTGIFLVLIVFGGIWLHPVSFLLLGLTIVIGSQVEFFRIVLHGDSKAGLISGLVISVTIYALSAFVASGELHSTFLLILIPLLVLLAIGGLFRKGDRHLEDSSMVLMGILYTTLPYILMVFSAFDASGFLTGFSPELILAFFVLLWINDTGAYLVGVTIGKHKLFERISPKKTWEGFAGGLVLTIVAAFFAERIFGQLSLGAWIISGAIVSVFATMGDLFESQIKRNAGVKDSGRILPGHGGFLDRFDGVTFAFPMVYLYLTFFG